MEIKPYSSNQSSLPVRGLDFYTPQPFALILAFNTIFVLATLANILHLSIVYVLSKQSSKRKLPISYRNFLVVLGVTDLALSVFRLVISNDAMQRLLLAHRTFCVISSIFGHSCVLIGANSILLVSIDRLLAVSIGVSYRSSWYVKHFTQILVVVVFLWLMLYATLAAFFWDIGFRVKGIGVCMIGSEIHPALGLISISFMAMNLIVICAIYGVMLRRMAKSIRRNQQMRHVNRSNRVIANTICALLFAKLCTWLPMISTIFIRMMKPDCISCEWIGMITLALNPLLNPIVYGVTNKTYAELLKAFRRRCLKL